jgi:hypothetical protein
VVTLVNGPIKKGYGIANGEEDWSVRRRDTKVAARKNSLQSHCQLGSAHHSSMGLSAEAVVKQGAQWHKIQAIQAWSG